MKDHFCHPPMVSAEEPIAGIRAGSDGAFGYLKQPFSRART